MDVKNWSSKIKKVLKQYRFPALVLLVGIMLMSIPKQEVILKSPPVETEENIPVESVLAEKLSKIEDAGRVEVLLSIASGEEIVYQTDIDQSQTDSNTTSRVTTITVSGSDRNESGLIKQINPPKYLGAIILCQGADRASVRLAIVDAVSKLTGLGADSISVLKMK